jgi:hypothetical protein
MRSVHAGADQGDFDIAASVPVGFTIGVIIGIDIHFVSDFIWLSEFAQVGGESVVVGSA